MPHKVSSKSSAEENCRAIAWWQNSSSVEQQINLTLAIARAFLCLVAGLQILNLFGSGETSTYAADKGSQEAMSKWSSEHYSPPPHAATGTVYYVSTAGSDSTQGNSRALPWRTIGHAALAMSPGDTTVVEGGIYDERVVVAKSGRSGKPISFVADHGAQVQLRGFQVTADYVRVTGFDITNQSPTQPQGWGVYVIGSHNLITHNNIHDLCFEGIYISGNGDVNSGSTAYNIVSNNTITRVEMAGARIEGQTNLVEDNDVSFTRQYPPNCPVRNGADADGFRFFGHGHHFVSNRIHDIGVPGSPYNLNPHTDCFQTWMTATDMIFDSNWCEMPAPYVNRSRAGNEGGSIENARGYVANLLFMNNVFINIGQGLIVQGDGSGPISGLRFFNNTLDNVIQEGLILKNVSGARIINNIFYDVGGGSDNYLISDRESSNIIVENNDMFMPQGFPLGSYGSNFPSLELDPGFAGADAFDLHLTSISRLIGVGTNLPEVRQDFDGKPRPQNRPFDLGAFQRS